MLILRDTVYGSCYVVDFIAQDLDIDRLEEANLEVAGPVANKANVQIISTEAENDGEDEEDQLYFTTCETEGCGKWILIIDDGAPEHCTIHTEDE